MIPVLSYFANRGIEVRVINGQLRIGPSDRVTENDLNIARSSRSLLTEIFQRGDPDNENARLSDFPRKDGWRLVSSKLMGEELVVVQHLSARIPAEHADKTVYTDDEIRLLRRSPVLSRREIHVIKKKFGGTLLPPKDYPFVK